MKKLLLALALLFLASPALAQSQRNPCFYKVNPSPTDGCQPVSSSHPLPVTSGGGGGGLSVQDQSVFTVGTSNFTPGGGFYNATPQALTSGTQGEFAASQYRALMVDTLPAANSNLTTILLAPTPLEAETAEPALTANGLAVPAMADRVGKQATTPYAVRELQLHCALAMTNVTAATTCTGMPAQGSNVSIYITDLVVTRSDAGTTAITATLNDTTNRAIDLSNNGGGGGYAKSNNVPFKIPANTPFQISLSAGVTAVHISADGFSGY